MGVPDFYVMGEPIGASSIDRKAAALLSKVDPRLPISSYAAQTEPGSLVGRDGANALYFLRYVDGVGRFAGREGVYGPLVAFVGILVTPRFNRVLCYSADGAYRTTRSADGQDRDRVVGKSYHCKGFLEVMKDQAEAATLSTIRQFHLHEPKNLAHFFNAPSELLLMGLPRSQG